MLREILEYAECNGLTSVISWLPSGFAFKIHDEKRFMEEVAPLFMRASKMRSFTANLYLWSFKRITNLPYMDCWHNEFFVRHRPTDMRHMRRRW